MAFLDGATRRLDLAFFTFDLQPAADALVRATQRGVTVRLVLDSDTLAHSRDAATRRAIATLQAAGIPLVGDDRQALMHHKFAVRDEDEVWTGSWNCTVGDTYRFNNHAVRIRSRALAANYTAEFEKLFVQRQFGPHKPPGVPHPQLTLWGARVATYFAPQDAVAARVIAHIHQAQRTIRFLAFSFTHEGIAQAVLDRARAGVAVTGVVERTGAHSPASQFRRLQAAGLAVYVDANPYAMHHKVFILDDTTVLCGSFNFSHEADQANDENLLVVTDAAFAQPFRAECARLVAAARRAR